MRVPGSARPPLERALDRGLRTIGEIREAGRIHSRLTRARHGASIAPVLADLGQRIKRARGALRLPGSGRDRRARVRDVRCRLADAAPLLDRSQRICCASATRLFADERRIELSPEDARPRSAAMPRLDVDRDDRGARRRSSTIESGAWVVAHRWRPRARAPPGAVDDRVESLLRPMQQEPVRRCLIRNLVLGIRAPRQAGLDVVGHPRRISGTQATGTRHAEMNDSGLPRALRPLDGAAQSGGLSCWRTLRRCHGRPPSESMRLPSAYNVAGGSGLGVRRARSLGRRMRRR